MSAGATIDVQVDDAQVYALLADLRQGLADRRALNEAISLQAADLTRSHLLNISLERHDTARRLGAEPTGFWGRGLEKTVASRADDSAAYVTVSHAGIGRAFHDVTIYPTEGRKWLTIPTAASSYGKTVYEVQRILGLRLFRPLKTGAKKIGNKPGPGRKSAIFDEKDRMKALGTSTGGEFVSLFALTESAFQHQDRTLLPSDEEFAEAALQGVETYRDSLMSTGGTP